MRGILKIKKDHIIVVFDGYCILCNYFTVWLAKRDEQENIFFTTFESEFIKKNFPHIQLNDTVFVIGHHDKVYTQAQAVIECLKKIKCHRFLRKISTIIPMAISNRIYRLTAKLRYHIFGKKKECTIPAEIVSKRILK